jgi:subtilase family serine protease
VGLPLHDDQLLTNLLAQLYNPTSTNFHRFLTPDEFTTRFAPTESQYQSVVRFMKTNGLAVTATHPNRTIVTIRGAVEDIERLFHVRLQVYQHPYEPRTFYAPDVDPSLDIDDAVLAITGLDNYQLPHPKPLRGTLASDHTGPTPRLGSGPSGTFIGMDFRAAYAPGTSLDGSGQVVGLFELNGYYAVDITTYEAEAGLPNVPLGNVLLDGYTGLPSGIDGPREVAADIEMVICMAPGLRQVTYYAGTFPNSILTEMAHPSQGEPLPMQISDSWGYPIDAQTIQLYRQIALQGQSYFSASGDDGAYSGPIDPPEDVPFITVVGGTVLQMTGVGSGWASETTWSGSGGGSSTTVPIPAWQLGIDMSANGGSVLRRNIPDVAMAAVGIFIRANNGVQYFGTVGGTSLAAPLWAGFTALVNQQATISSKPPIGFLNPAIYAIGKGPGYGSAFHDIRIGNNTNSFSNNTNFFAVPGYDLCTGWGTPKGTNLINALLYYAGQVWVEFNPACPNACGDGMFGNPFNSLTVATNVVSPGGTIFFKPGTSGNCLPNQDCFPMNISERMTFDAPLGPATLGR